MESNREKEQVESYNFVDHPQHYNEGGVEVIEMMLRIWGKEAVKNFCELNAFKYRMRMGSKPNQSLTKELSKAKWYEDYAKNIEVEF